jgi:hypothetical protein
VSMNTHELWDALRSAPCTKHHIGAVCAVDELISVKSITVLPRIFIVNTDTHDQPGKHWVCFYFPQDGPTEFFDSLGKHPQFYSKMFVNFIFRHSSEFVYNLKPLQSDSSSTCGHFCLFYSALRCRGISTRNILSKFSDDKLMNDELVRHFAKEYFDTSARLGTKCQNCLSPDKCW